MNIEHATAPQPVGFIHFHGYHLLIVRHQGIEYTEAKPVSDLCKLDWRSSKRTISSAENAILYATTALLAPQIGSSGGTSTPLSDDSGATRGPQRPLYLRLDRVRMFMARINTAHVRAKGNHEGANQVLAQYQHQTRALAWWPRCGLEEISEPGITERRRQRRQNPPTMIQELELIDELNKRGRYSAHNHRHSARCRCSRSRSHSHGPF